MRYPYLILARNLGEELEHLFYLAREDVDALYLHHVVSSSHYGVKPWEAAAALAFAGDYPRQVVSSVSDERRALLAKGGYDYLTHLAVGHGPAADGVDYLDIDIVVPVVHTAVVFAAYTDTRAVYLGQTVDIVKLDAQLVGNTLSHLFTPAL